MSTVELKPRVARIIRFGRNIGINVGTNSANPYIFTAYFEGAGTIHNFKTITVLKRVMKNVQKREFIFLSWAKSKLVP
jgi:hypothetical protein